MRAARVDANHSAVKKAFERLGCDVLDLSKVGGGCPDLLIRIRAINLMCLVEVKTETGKLKPSQVEFAERWPVEIVRSLTDVERVVSGDTL